MAMWRPNPLKFASELLLIYTGQSWSCFNFTKYIAVKPLAQHNHRDWLLVEIKANKRPLEENNELIFEWDLNTFAELSKGI